MNNEINRSCIISEAAARIGEAALLGMLYEISTSPSPGLISPISNGAHKDMDYFMFLRSTAAIHTAMYECALTGLEQDMDLLAQIRKAGLAAEKRMFAATGGVNTQKGLLFMAGVVCCAAGRCIRLGEPMDRYGISEQCGYICSGMVEIELQGLEKKVPLSNGERIYLEYGISGVRGEAESGLPTVLCKGLPGYEASLAAGLCVNDALVDSLVAIMSVLDDTTVLNRCGPDGIEMMHSMAQTALDLGGMRTAAGRKIINKMDMFFTAQNISPGGAADLLAVTVMVHEMEKIM